jgi:hypothetical protein
MTNAKGTGQTLTSSTMRKEDYSLREKQIATDRPGSRGGGMRPIFVLNPGTRSFWMISVSSSIVIIILIANLPLLYHKPKNTRIPH